MWVSCCSSALAQPSFVGLVLLPSSLSMTTVSVPYSQTSFQKSPIVLAIGAWVAMYLSSNENHWATEYCDSYKSSEAYATYGTIEQKDAYWRLFLYPSTKQALMYDSVNMNKEFIGKGVCVKTCLGWRSKDYFLWWVHFPTFIFEEWTFKRHEGMVGRKRTLQWNCHR